MKRRALLLFALVLASFAASAQQLPPGRWWRRPEIVKQLQITGAQQEKLDEVFRLASSDLIDAKASAEKLAVELRSELDRKEVRRQEVQRIAAQLNAARGRLFERELMMLLDMRATMSDEQWTKVRTFFDRMQERGEGPRGPGAMRRPGAGRRRP